MSSKKTLRFSVVIPCYNEEDYIGSTLSSLKAQDTSADYEVIVVDNNCNDATVSIARSYGAKVVTESQPGICAARQAGTTAANGEIIISTDADTTFSPDWLSKIDSAFKNDPDLIAYCGPCRFKDTPWWGRAYTPFLFGWSYLYFLITGHPFYVTATNIAFKKQFWKGYDPLLMQGGDEVGLLHQLKHEGKVAFSLKNPVYTSGRRLQRGMFYNIFVTFLYYYLAGYVINSLFGRKIIGAPPAFRNEYRSKLYSRLAVGLIALCLVVDIAKPRLINGFVTDNISDASKFVVRMI